jgi:hypothetical protein
MAAMQPYPPPQGPPGYPPPGYPPQGQPPPGYPPQGQPPPQGAAGRPPPSDARNIVRWGALGILLLGFLLVVGTGIAGMSSESAGVTMAYVTAAPLGFGLAGFVVALLTRKSQSSGVAVGAPLGCGCFSAFMFVALAVVFFNVIFPML